MDGPRDAGNTRLVESREHDLDAAVTAALRPGPFPSGLIAEVEDVWTAVTALEALVHGRVASAGRPGAALARPDLRELRRLAARLAVLAVVAEGAHEPPSGRAG